MLVRTMGSFSCIYFYLMFQSSVKSLWVKGVKDINSARMGLCCSSHGTYSYVYEGGMVFGNHLHRMDTGISPTRATCCRCSGFEGDVSTSCPELNMDITSVTIMSQLSTHGKALLKCQRDQATAV